MAHGAVHHGDFDWLTELATRAEDQSLLQDAIHARCLKIQKQKKCNILGPWPD